MIICPACDGALEKHEHGYVLCGCTTCGGIFADTATAKMVHDGMRKHLLAAAAGNIEADASRREAPAEAERRCPVCQRAMTVHVWHGVNVDVCDAHGVWFDRGELAAVAMRLNQGGDRAALVMPKTNARHVPSWARVGGAAAVAAAGGAAVGFDDDGVDVLGAGLDVLDALLD